MKSSWSFVSTGFGWMLLVWVGVAYSPSVASACADGGPVGRAMDCCSTTGSSCHCCLSESPIPTVETRPARSQPLPSMTALRKAVHTSCDCGASPQVPANAPRQSPSQTSVVQRTLEFSSWVPIPTDLDLTDRRWHDPSASRARPLSTPLHLCLSRLQR